MKKIFLLAVLALAGFSANAQTKPAAKPTTKVETPKVDGAGMLFENETLDYGTINQNAEGKREFVFTNNGNKPLVIETTQGSCGCTVPTKPEKPIQPGEKGVIGVKYDTNRVGNFTKTITIKSNAAGQETKVITIKGNVLATTPAEGTAPTKS